MKQDKVKSEPFDDLRKQVKALQPLGKEDISQLSISEARNLIQELQIRQAELNVQNEAFQEILPETEASLRRMEHLLACSPAVTYSYEARGDHALTFMSENIREETGYAPSEFMDDPRFWLDRVHPEDVQRVMNGLSALSGQGCYIDEYRFRHKDGMYRWKRSRVRLVYDEQGLPAEYVYSWIDIDEHKQAEEQVRESRKTSHTLLSATHDAAALLDMEGTILAINGALAKSLGNRPDEMIGRNVFSLMPNNLANSGRQQLEKAIRKKQPVRFSNECTGTVLDNNIYPILDTKGNVTRIALFARDISNRRRSKEALRHRMAMEELVADISTSFINAASDKVGHRINRALKAACTFAGVDSSYIFLLSDDGMRVERFYEWHSERIRSRIEQNEAFSLESFRWLMGKLRRFEIFHIPRIADLPPQASDEKERWQAQGVQSVLAIPIALDDSLIGFLRFASISMEKIWSDEDIRLVRLLGEIFASVFARKKAEETLQHRLAMEELIATISAIFINVTPAKADDEIRYALEAVGKFLKVERCYVFLFTDDRTRIRHVYEWYSEQSRPIHGAYEHLLLEPFQWAMKTLGNLEIIHVPSVPDLLCEARAEKELWQAQGVQSLLAVPMVMNRSLNGCFGISSVRTEKKWAKEDIILLRLLGEIFANVLERKSAEDKLLASKERLRAQYMGFPVPTYTWRRENDDFVLIDYNIAADTFTKEKMSQFIGEKLSVYCHEPDVIAHCEACYRERKTLRRQIHYRLRATGEQKHLDVTYVFVPPDLVMGHAKDISEIRQAQAAWRKFEFIANSSKDFMTLINRDYVYEAANRSYRKYFNKSKDEIVGRHVAEVWGWDVFEGHIKARIDKCFAGEEGHFEGWIEFHGKGRGYYDVSYYPYFDDNGKVTHVAVFSLDLTKRRKAEEALRDSEQKLTSMLHSIGDHISMIDKTFTILWANETAQKVFGTGIIGKKCHAVYRDRNTPCRHCISLKVFEDGHTHEQDTQVPVRSGRTIHFHCTASAALKNNDGTPVSVIKIARDVTERKIARKKLEQAYEDLRDTQAQLVQSAKLASIGELAAGVAHELNQPLMVIRGSTQLMLQCLREDDLSKEEMMEDLKMIERNTGRMMKIINHLRAFSRQFHPDFCLTNVNTIIEDAFLMISQQLRVHNISVEKKLGRNLPQVQGNANQLEQVILNLITNARDAIEEKRHGGERNNSLETLEIITKIAKANKGAVEILFRDTGVGISPGNADRIFDPFFTTKEVGKGTGLGLSIAYGIIKDHGGDIEVVETGLNGAMFRIRLPVVKV